MPVDKANKILDAREFRFVENYTNPRSPTCGKAFPSAKAAGYAHSSAEVYAHLWVTDRPDNEKPHVYRAIQQRREELENITKMGREEILQELMHMAGLRADRYTMVTPDGEPYIDLSNLTSDEWAGIAETQVEDYVEGRGEDSRTVRKVRVKQYDKKGALELLGKALGMFNAQLRIQHSNDPNNPMPGSPSLDLTLLTEEELITYRTLVAKAMGK